MTRFNTNFLDCLPFSDTVIQVGLLANAEANFIIPGNKDTQYRCEFSYASGDNVWVGYNDVAILPPAGVITIYDTYSLVLNPKIKYVRGGDTLSFMSGSAVTNMGIELLLLPS